MGPDGTIHVVWQDDSSGNREIFYTQLPPGGTWSTPENVSNNSGSSEALHRRLAEVDPATAGRLHPNDRKRIIRALEVHAKTGRPISELQRQFDVGRPAEECRVFVLDWPRDQLHQRIDRRVEAMFAGGLVAEVERLTSGGRHLGRTASQAVGYREVIAALAGECDLETAKARVKTRTRRFAKRQNTWFRSLPECRPVPLDERIEPAAVAESIMASWRRA